MKLEESGEMYLETIYVLSRKTGYVRSVDVADYMGYSKPSVSRAVGLLKSGGFITMSEDGSLNLTETGKEHAEKIFERHSVIAEFLISLGVGEEVAALDACKMEHYISDESFDAIKKYISER